jgi:histidine triad (HIT) family protein
MTSEFCVFCRIVLGFEPAHVFHANSVCFAITPLKPVVDGHFLVIPVKHVTDACEDPQTSALAMRDAATWAASMAEQGDERYKSVNIITSVGRPATQSVFHLHLHVVPRRENDGLALPWTDQRIKDSEIRNDD